MLMKFKYEKEFRKAHPETIGEKESIFDLVNYTEWLETIVGQIEPLVMQKIAEVSEKDYEEYYNSPAVQEFMNAPGGKPQKIKLADLNYYKNIIATQNDSEILKLELQDLIKDIEEEREQR